jgi:hypothetical protein
VPRGLVWWFTDAHSVEAATENLDSTYVLDSHVLVQKFVGHSSKVCGPAKLGRGEAKKKSKCLTGFSCLSTEKREKSKNKHT